MAQELEARRRYMARADVKEKRKEYDARYMAAHPLTAEQKAARLEYKRQRYRRNCARERERSWAAWGIDMTYWSYAKYLVMLNVQANKCFACSSVIVATRAELTDAAQVAQVDHDHETGRVNGLLCGHCNMAKGQFGDNVKVMQNLAAMLERTESPNVN